MSYNITFAKHFVIVIAISSSLLCSLCHGISDSQSPNASTEREARAMVKRLEEAFNSVSVEKLQNIVVANKENDEWIDDIRDIKKEKGSVNANLKVTRIYRKDKCLVAETLTTFVVNGKPETKNARMLYYFATTKDGLKLKKTEHPAVEKSNQLIRDAMRLGKRLETAANNKDYATISSMFYFSDDTAKGIRESDIEVFKKLNIYWLYEVVNDPSLTLKANGASRVNTPDTAKVTVQIIDKEGKVLSSRSLIAKWFTQGESKQEVCFFSLLSSHQAMEE